jgi:peptide/nickel transport system substrate-binding protein
MTEVIMTSVTRRWAALAAAVLAAAGLAACGGSGSSGSSAASGTPVYGGTLRIEANGGPDHIDSVQAYIVADYILMRAYTRQLVSYRDVNVTATSGPTWQRAITVVPDAATEVPTKANGGISANGLVYTFHIKPGVMWDTKPPRQVTADDFIRQFKAFCNPVQPVGNLLYFEATIAGFTSYCNAETAYFSGKGAPKPTAASIAAFQHSHAISGMSALSPTTLRIRLTQPASDFLNIMAMPFASARPAEYDSYVPDSARFRQHTISDGPYQITQYVPGKTIVMSRNPAWKQSTDTIRHQYVSKIVVTMGTSSAQTMLANMQANTADLDLDVPLSATSIPGLLASHDKRLRIWPGSNTYDYTAFNFRSPDANHAMSKLLVRQAIEYGINKADIQKVLGGPKLSKIINTAIPPGNSGYQPYNLYPTPGNAGNPATCRSLLAQAGYPHGLTLVDLYSNDTQTTAVFQSIQGSLAKCGITLKGKPETGSTFFVDYGNAPQNNKPGAWDLAQPSWFPDWYGNDGRTTLQPLFQTNCVVNTVNGGCFSSKAVDSLIAQALRAPTAAAAAPLWHQVDVDVMKQAAIVPVIDAYTPQYASSRVKSAGLPTANFDINITGPDITNIWLNPPHP